MTANDVAAFARDSAKNKVTVLGPADFPERVVDSRDPWVVDFYAPVNFMYNLYYKLHIMYFYAC